VIKEIDAEEHQYLYVIANSGTTNKSGYHTSKIDAKNILGNEKFKVTIYNQDGILVYSSNSVVNKTMLLHYLANSSKGKVQG